MDAINEKINEAMRKYFANGKCPKIKERRADPNFKNVYAVLVDYGRGYIVNTESQTVIDSFFLEDGETLKELDILDNF